MQRYRDSMPVRNNAIARFRTNGDPMLNRNQFKVLACYKLLDRPTQRDVSLETGLSLGTVNHACLYLRKEGLLNHDFHIAPAGEELLEQYRVRNAVILAAGSSTRFTPLSFEKPKAMFEVRGEVLIERLVRQLREAGIDEIVVVAGYMKECFFYLEEELGVKLLFTDDYVHRNNHASLLCARDYLDRTYVLSSDEYYERNIFSPYAFDTYLSASPNAGRTERLIPRLNTKSRISSIQMGKEAGVALQGPACFSPEFSRRFSQIIADEYDLPETADKLWEEVLSDHLGEFTVYIEPYEEGVIYEFDYVTDLTAFDEDFFVNVDSRILDNICRTLACERTDIADVEPIKAGLSNLSVLFTACGRKYVYRHPGNGTDEIISRASEARSLEVAKKLGLDDTFVFEDSTEGWKISEFIEGCSEFDVSNTDQVERAMDMIRTLHESGEESDWDFDFYENSKALKRLLEQQSYPLPRGFCELEARIDELWELMADDEVSRVLCHNDFYAPNILVRGDDMWLIDWEYSGMSDPVCDVANFVAQGPPCSVEEALDVYAVYLRCDPAASQARHFLGCVAVVGWHWYVWAIYKEARGHPVGDWLYLWYKAASKFAAAACDGYAR